MANRRSLIGEAAVMMMGGGGIDTNNYLTIVALEDGLTAKLSTNACEYCVDGDGNWKTLTKATNTETINTGHTLSFRGNLTPTTSGIGTFTISKSCNLEGNCMSMLFGDDASNNFSLHDKDYAFYQLFYDCTTIKSISSGFLPATTLADNCYGYMFSNCTKLTQAPTLPATTLANYCYYYMFDDCTNLTTSPTLPATTLASYCYRRMFNGCTILATSPTLPATTLASYCYYEMFYGCTNLTQAPVLPATTLVDSCYGYMFYGCTNLTQAPVLPAMTLAYSCYSNMFRQCTNLTQAPVLPARTLVDKCYWYMFQGCTKLNYIKAMFTTTPSSSYTYNWVAGVASSGQFIKSFQATWDVTGKSGIPSGWTITTA